MKRGLASPTDLSILKETFHLRLIASRAAAGELGTLARLVAEHAASAVDTDDGEEAVAALRAAAAGLEQLRAQAFTCLRAQLIPTIAFDDLASACARCRRELDRLSARLRGRAWLRLTSGGVDESAR